MPSESKKNCETKILASVAVILFILLITLLFIFFEVKSEYYNYFLNLYGDSLSLDSKALAVIVARDGVVVPNPDLYVNGKKTPHALIDLRPDLKEISVKVGKFESVFPINYKMIETRGTPEKKFIQFSESEIKKAPVAPISGTKMLFLLPDQFRAVPEFEFNMHIFCLDNGEPCKDRSIFINGTETEMKKGHSVFKTVFDIKNSLQIMFADGSSIVTETPYIGKMLRFTKNDSRIFITGLTDLSNVHIDCYNKNRWLGTDIISVSSSGTELPGSYLNCDTIQASLNSAAPGSTVAVMTDIPYLLGPVTDSYYKPLGENLDKFEPDVRQIFATSYNSSFFRVLPLIFPGEELEKNFNKEQKEQLDSLWWSIFFASVAGFILFIYAIIRKFKIVKGLDEELISYSINYQSTILAVAALFYVLFFIFLLFLLRNMA